MTVTQQQLGERIRIAQERFHLTPRELGEFVDLSTQDIEAIERGERSSLSNELLRIAYATGRNPWEFFQDDFADGGALAGLFRVTSQPTDQTQLKRALQEGIAYALQFALLEEQSGISRPTSLPSAVELPEPTDCVEALRQGEQVAVSERCRLRLGEEAPYRMQHLLETQGVGSVAAPLPDNVSGFVLSDPRYGTFVLFNAAQSRSRRRFSLAHEYGHVLMDRHRMATPSTIGKPQDLIELRADAFAAGFLMPENGVRRKVEGERIGMLEVAAVAQAFEVSRRAALRRIKDLRLVTDEEHAVLLAQEEKGDGQPYSTLLGLFDSPEVDSRRESQGRLLGLAFEAFRRERISRRKLTAIGRGQGVDDDTIAKLVHLFGME